MVALDPLPLEQGYFGAAATLVAGPPAEALQAVLAATDPRWPVGAGQAHRAAGLAALGGVAEPAFGPVALARTVAEQAGGRTVTVDAGAHMLAAMPLLTITHPHQLLISNGLATMGYALPAAIGAALARPGARVLCLVGDGGWA